MGKVTPPPLRFFLMVHPLCKTSIGDEFQRNHPSLIHLMEVFLERRLFAINTEYIILGGLLIIRHYGSTYILALCDENVIIVGPVFRSDIEDFLKCCTESLKIDWCSSKVWKININFLKNC